MKIVLILSQLVFFIILSPLLSGLISKIKNNLRMRRGQSILQPYYNLIKLFSKGQVVSQTTSWIFGITPVVVIASALAGSLLAPVFTFPTSMHLAGDFLALIFIFTLGRFFLSLAALDAGSSFGGMGSSREMFISSLVEPALCLTVFSLFLQFGSTDISSFNAVKTVSVSSIVGAIALFMVAIAETSRIPVDNQETHLELTMIHEAMTLEYSGRSLALIEMAAYIKQLIWFFLIAQIIFPMSVLNPSSLSGLFLWGFYYIIRILVIAAVMAVVEVSVAKMRLFRVTDFLGFVFVLGLIATICAILRV